MKIVALAGGVGGAKLAEGLSQVLPPGDLTVIVNTADDFIHFGLHISPDIDTVCYTLAGIANHEHGWGLEQDTFHVLSSVNNLQGPTWFSLGDRDIATHLERTRRMNNGETLSQVTESFCQTWNIKSKIMPMTDQTVATMVHTTCGRQLSFQEYFVKEKCIPEVKGFSFTGIENAFPSPGALDAIKSAEAVVICPSNPWVSIDPILAVKGYRETLIIPTVVAVSPIIHGKTIKGPAAKMFKDLGYEPTAVAVALHYGELLDGFIIDNQDIEMINDFPIRTIESNIHMRGKKDRRRVAQLVLDFIRNIHNP
jgi:LPPG:FO 2-phospho-L-lactate transferase